MVAFHGLWATEIEDVLLYLVLHIDVYYPHLVSKAKHFSKVRYLVGAQTRWGASLIIQDQTISLNKHVWIITNSLEMSGQ